MTAIPGVKKTVHFIDQPAALEHCIQDLSAQQVIAFDLEFDSHHHAYGVTLCLIQIATPDKCYIIDPFASIDLKQVYRVFENDQILKIVHSPGEDLRLLHRSGCYPKNLYDTEVVAKLLNFEQTSLAAMLQEMLGLTMSKQQQKSNWLRRPLTPEQIQYAADDVAWLHQLKDALEQKASQKELDSFVVEEQAALSTTIYRAEVKDHFLKPADKYNLSPYDQYVLNELFIYRDALAQQINKPAFQVMAEDVARELVAGTLVPYDLADEKGVHRNLKSTRLMDELADRLDEFREKARQTGLSRSLPPREIFTPEQQEARSKANRDRIRKFTPIQQALAEKYGTHAARLILSSTAVNDLLSKAISLDGLKHAYRKKLVLDTAANLGIDLSHYE